MAKKYLDKNVYDLAKERFEYIFNEFDKILIAFSGGKDSSVCLEIAYDYAKKNNCLEKLAMYHIDYEAQYQMTTDFVTETFKRFKDIERYWLCLPIKAQCCCSIDKGYWIPWDEKNKDLWVREMPKYEYVINYENCEFNYNGTDYEVQDRFCRWFAKRNGRTAVIIGIRTDESLNRYRAIKSSKKVKSYKKTNYINGLVNENQVYKCYPIYDWTVEDIWIYNGKFNKKYNKLYDLYYQAGLSIEQMRVASPFNDQASASLKLYKVIDPNNWSKMVGRVNGVNFTAIYGGTTAMGWRNITKPSHFTWEEYCYFLLDTLDEKTKQHYLKKLNTSLEFWKNKGGTLDEETIAELEAQGIEFENTGKQCKTSTKDVVKFDKYLDDVDIKNFKAIPTYKRMCVCIMKNDYYCKYMGFAQTKEEIIKRKKAVEKYSSL